jgi:hypothetical protein
MRTLALVDSRMRFAPAIDCRLVLIVARTADLGCAAAVWRLLRVRARRLDVDTPCYESVRRLVRRERRRRRILEAIERLLELLRRVARRLRAALTDRCLCRATTSQGSVPPRPPG